MLIFRLIIIITKERGERKARTPPNTHTHTHVACVSHAVEAVVDILLYVYIPYCLSKYTLFFSLKVLYVLPPLVPICHTHISYFTLKFEL